MPSEILRDSALRLLNDPNLFDLVVIDTQKAFGIHGENELIQILYLAISSRRLPDPLSVIVQGESGSGKTYVIDSLCRFVPPAELWEATHCSPRALYYDREGVKHKVLNAKERSRATGPEAEEQSSAIRQLISDKRIVNRTVSQDRMGEHHIVEGPICLLQSTTLKDDKIFDEDLSRCLLLRTESNSDHRRAVLKAIGQRNGDHAALQEQVQSDIIEKHLLIQGELLERLRVVVPFQAELADSFPVSAAAMTRLFERLLFCIRACAYLHQYQRDRDRGSIVASLNSRSSSSINPLSNRACAASVEAVIPSVLGTKVSRARCRSYLAIRRSSLGRELREMEQETEPQRDVAREEPYWDRPCRSRYPSKLDICTSGG